jgi:hypothetical protein
MKDRLDDVIARRVTEAFPHGTTQKNQPEACEHASQRDVPPNANPQRFPHLYSFYARHRIILLLCFQFPFHLPRYPISLRSRLFRALVVAHLFQANP